MSCETSSQEALLYPLFSLPVCRLHQLGCLVIPIVSGLNLFHVVTFEWQEFMWSRKLRVTLVQISAKEQPSRFCCRLCINQIIPSTTKTPPPVGHHHQRCPLLNFLPFPSLPTFPFEVTLVYFPFKKKKKRRKNSNREAPLSDTVCFGAAAGGSTVCRGQWGNQWLSRHCCDLWFRRKVSGLREQVSRLDELFLNIPPFLWMSMC